MHFPFHHSPFCAQEIPIFWSMGTSIIYIPWWFSVEPRKDGTILLDSINNT